MDFGIFNIMQQRDRAKSARQVYQEAIEQTVVAEQLGFKKAWYAEHHFSNYSLCSSPLMMVGHMAGRTNTIRLGTAVVVAPLYNPARLLSEIGMADVMSEGRLELGIGQGYQGYETDRFGVDLNRSGEMTDEMLDLLELGISNRSFDYNGQHYTLPRSAVAVRPLQKDLPIWYAGSNPTHLRRMARKRHGYLISGVLGGVSRMLKSRQAFEQAAREEGQDPETIKIGIARMAFVTNKKSDALHFMSCALYQQRLSVSAKARREKMTDDYVMEEVPYADEPTLDAIERNLPVGSVDRCIENMVRTIRTLRPHHIMIQTQVGDMDHKKSLASMELWMSEVVPGIARELAKSNRETEAANVAQ